MTRALRFLAACVVGWSCYLAFTLSASLLELALCGGIRKGW